MTGHRPSKFMLVADQAPNCGVRPGASLRSR